MNKTHEVEQLIDKAAAASKSEDALRFSQAACNAANAMSVVQHVLTSGAQVPPPTD